MKRIADTLATYSLDYGGFAEVISPILLGLGTLACLLNQDKLMFPTKQAEF